MDFYNLVFNNILNLPLICFVGGIIFAFLFPAAKRSEKLNKFLIFYILLCIGLKGGGPLIQHIGSSGMLFFTILAFLVIWGLLQPFLSFYLLKTFTRIDTFTIAAISASFGSVSIMTFVAAISFLDHLQVKYLELIIAALAIMEIPAIISGIVLAKKFDQSNVTHSPNVGSLVFESLFNKPIMSILGGLGAGAVFYTTGLSEVSGYILSPFKPVLCLFLFDMGRIVAIQRGHFKSFTWGLRFFGIYMPLIGGCFGLCLSRILDLDVGTGTLIAVLAASASYIAVPAAMRIALPQAKEAIYLPLSIGIAFPFNVIIGIPIYYQLALKFLK
jgi:hypothetical protein